MGHARHTLAYIHATRNRCGDLFHEPDQRLRVPVRCRRREQGVFLYEVCYVRNDWGACHRVGRCNRAVPDGEDGELAVGVCMLRQGGKDSGPGPEFSGFRKALHDAGELGQGRTAV